MTKKVLFFVTILGLLAFSLFVVVPALAAEPLRGGPSSGGRGGSTAGGSAWATGML